MTKTYTLAELKTMEAALDAELDAERNKVEVQLPALPEDVAEFQTTLPLEIFNLDGDEVSVISYKHVHKALGIGNRPTKWFSILVDKYGFEENVDFIALKYDPNTEEGRRSIGANGGVLVYDYLVTSDMAKELAMLDKTDLGRRVRKYFLIAERVAKKYAAEQFKTALSLKNKEIAGFNREYNASFKKSIEVAKSLGFDGRTQMINQINEIKVRDDLITQLREEGAKAVGYKSLERLIEKAAGHLHKVKNNPDKVMDAASELLEGLGQINNGNVGYCSSF